MISNPCLRCSEPLLALLPPLLDPDQAREMPHDHGRQVRSTFREVAQSIADLGLPEPEREAVLHALAALVDERVLCSTWPGREAWLHDTLQMADFGDHLGGERFFTRMEAFRRHPQAHQHLLELYLACLQMGFQGIYRLRGDTALHALQAELSNQIESLQGPEESALAVSATAVDMTHEKTGAGRLNWMHITLLTLALITTMALLQGIKTHQMFQGRTELLQQTIQQLDAAPPTAGEAHR
ncbi:type IVB secretion system protein IcmH/DotU [Ectothiorhodospira lacustris]|uniref:type IVB secretion system protein IcmH/DotU n=1 Tax=Ectothiorhodospira lacustris TaxID=2899127 RepID=UPI001EE91C03|nr:type IVB secretion system protein IcmH/DotU [Ectothiorhodospira lacustris]MCG5499365.1 type IVB secretion system protein IcmH/DotU [Ectothiorhodospira lacustris]